MAHRPNILIFMMDTQPVANMTCYGYPRDTTPNVQRIAAEGLVYERHYVTGCWTVPSHSSLFTGKYQCGHGAGVQHEFLSPRFPTVAEALADAGYQTVGFSNNSWVSQDETNIARGFERWIMVPRPSGQNVQIGPEDDFVLDTGLDAGAAITVDRVKEWFAKEHRADRPFFMFINCVEPHLRVWAPEPFRSQFLPDDISEERAREVNQDVFAERLGLVPNRPDGHMSGEDRTILKHLYDGSTACLDERMGRLFDFLRHQGILDETLLVITSDHGHSIGDGNFMGKRGYPSAPEVYDIPLLIRFPEARHGGQCSDMFVQHHDISAAILELAGVQPPTEIDGMPFLNDALSGRPGARQSVTVGWGSTPTVITDRWWFNVKMDGSGVLLYDLDAPDPFSRNVAGLYPDVVDKLFAQARQDAGGVFPDWLVDLAQSQADAPGCSDLAART